MTKNFAHNFQLICNFRYKNKIKKKEEEAQRWRQVISLLRIKEQLATKVVEKKDPTLLEENRLVL